MSKTCQLKVEDIPPGTTSNRLKIIFQNGKKQGGGRVISVEVDESEKSVVITFEEREAVETVLQKGNTVDIDGKQCKVYSVLSGSTENSYPVNKSSPPQPSLNSIAVVKINSNDVTKECDNYDLYLEDEDVNTGTYENSKVYMDGLQRAVYVQFHQYKDAQNVCTDKCEAAFIKSIELAKEDVYDHYPSWLSIHGMDFSSEDAKLKLKQYVKDKIKISPKLIPGEEPCSVILDLKNKVSDIDLYSLAWKCVGKLEDFQLVTAPVRKSSTLVAEFDFGIDSLDKSTVKRYFKNEKRSDGGIIKDIIAIEEGKLLVIFNDIDVASRVIKKKDHMIGKTKIETKLWHHCLSREAYKTYCGKQVENTDTRGQVDFSKSLELKVYEYGLLFRSELINNMKKTCSSIIVEKDDEHNKIIIKGPKQSVEVLENNINEYWKEFERLKIEGFEGWKKDYIVNCFGYKKMNDLLAKQEIMAYIYLVNANIWCYLKVEEDATMIKDIINNTFHVHTENVQEGQIETLKFDQGKEFISNLIKSEENLCDIKTGKNEMKYEIFTFGNDERVAFKIIYEINAFINNNKKKRKCMKFPKSKVEFASKFGKHSEVEKRLRSQGGSLIMDDNRITIQGLQTDIDVASKKLSSIMEQIKMEEDDLHYFGIAEYLKSNDGLRILKDITKKYNCLIMVNDNPAAEGAKLQVSQKRANLVGSCGIGNLSVKFMYGDITSLVVDVLVNPVNNRLELKYGLNKVIVDKGGKEIQKSLNDYQGMKEPGTIIKTDGGKLSCPSIFHLVMPSHANARDLLSYVKDLLREADQDKLSSIALSFIGCGNFGIPPVTASINISKGVKAFSHTASSIKEVIICDMDPSYILKIMDRFDNVKLYCLLDEICAVAEDNGNDETSDRGSSKNKGSPSSGEKKFGSISLQIKQGDILQEQCDAIACGLKDNMNLDRGGAVSKAIKRQCGPSLQDECNQKANEMKQSGAISVTTSGLPFSNIIFVSMDMFSYNWHQGVHKVLSLAETNGYSSIALPAFGTGTRHANVPKLKMTIYKAIEKFGTDSNVQSLKEVRLVIFDTNVLQVFQRDDDDSDHERKEYSVSVSKVIPLPEVCETVKVQIYYETHENDAYMELNNECKRNFHIDEYKVDIREISPKMMNELIVEGLKEHVLLTVDKNTGYFSLKGFNTNSIDKLIKAIWTGLSDNSAAQKLKDISSINTVYKWQFLKDEDWKDFDPRWNHEIEKAFDQSEKYVEISDGKFRINFESMKKEVWKGDKWKKVTTVQRFDLETETLAYPKTWEKMDEGPLKIVSLHKTSMEYKDVKKMFENGGVSANIKKIERIQNEVVYKQYTSKRIYFNKNNPNGTENVKRLFHGTDADKVKTINANGFDRSFCGQYEPSFGHGVHFTIKSSDSEAYAKPDQDGHKKMYLAKVLVGEPTQSQADMKFLPYKPGKNVPFDSGQASNIYIIFNDSQAYPEYVITF